MALILALISVASLGYLAQTTGLCMVRGVNECKSGKPEFLLAILSSGSLAWVAMLYSHYFVANLSFKSFAVTPWFFIGGVIFGLGTALNQGCGVSTLGKLARGDTKMTATIVGWLLGWLALTNLKINIDATTAASPGLVTCIILLAFSVALSLWVLFSDKDRKVLWFSMMSIGLLAGFVFLFQSNWPPSGLLKQLSSAMVLGSHWPSLHQYLLFLALLSGMFLAAWRTKRFSFLPVSLTSGFKHLAAGCCMGIGASLAMGGNDTQLLMALPTLSASGMLAVIGILVGIWLGLFIIEKVTSQLSNK